MEERSRSAERLGILFLSHRNPIPEPVLGLRLFDSYAVCYGKLYPHLDYLRHWLREPNHQALFSEDNIREFDRQVVLVIILLRHSDLIQTWLDCLFCLRRG